MSNEHRARKANLMSYSTLTVGAWRKAFEKDETDVSTLPGSLSP